MWLTVVGFSKISSSFILKALGSWSVFSRFPGSLWGCVPWLLWPRSRTVVATCRCGRCELPAISRVTPEIARAQTFAMPKDLASFAIFDFWGQKAQHRISKMLIRDALNYSANSDTERCKPYAERVFCLWRALFWIRSRRPRAQGVGVDPCFLNCGKMRTLLPTSLAYPKPMFREP